MSDNIDVAAAGAVFDSRRALCRGALSVCRDGTVAAILADKAFNTLIDALINHVALPTNPTRMDFELALGDWHRDLWWQFDLRMKGFGAVLEAFIAIDDEELP
jgi:hypothetical protein